MIGRCVHIFDQSEPDLMFSRTSVMCYIVKYRDRFCGTSVGSQRFYAIRKSTRGNDPPPAPVPQPVDLSKLPTADQFGVLSAQADSGRFPLHSSLKGRAVSHMKITDEILHEPLEDQLREQGLHRGRDHPRYQRNSQLLAKHCKEGNVEAACSQFFDIMLTEERVTPSRFDAHRLLDALANSGRSADAFKVYQKLKELGISPTQATFSRLFRACAEDASVWFRENEPTFHVCTDGQLSELRRRQKYVFPTKVSPLTFLRTVFPARIISNSPSMLQRALPTEHLLEQFGGPGLQRAQMLYQELRHKSIQLTQVTYNTLLLALARGGDMQSCMATLDDMLKAAKYNSPKNPTHALEQDRIRRPRTHFKPPRNSKLIATDFRQFRYCFLTPPPYSVPDLDLFLIQFSVACACLTLSTSDQRIIVEAAWQKSTNATKIDMMRTFQCCGFRRVDLPHDHPMGCPPCHFSELSCCEGDQGHQADCCTGHTNSSIPRTCPCTVTCWSVVEQKLERGIRVTGTVGLFFSLVEVNGFRFCFVFHLIARLLLPTNCVRIHLRKRKDVFRGLLSFVPTVLIW
ncbi:tetraspanin-31-B [Clonorchis sinensis]|uniref:Tetraspanin-31-B n=1 Tax=Clonorchis sinensis TaxID=79923 RepID=G7YJ74_CLOSI|nr:tetraspanin-31-B [Clonorchis sinensis]